MHKEIYERIAKNGIAVKYDINLKRYSSFRIGGIGAVAIYPNSPRQAVECIDLLVSASAEFTVIGKGSNILFGDGYVDRAFVFTEGISELDLDGSCINAGAGVSLAALSVFAADNSLSGFEFARGIPGSLGGAVFMNAGAYGGDMSDIVVSSTAYDITNGDVIEVTDHAFGYRSSVYMNNEKLICLGCKMSLKPADKDEIRNKMSEYTVLRKEKQPLNLPSAGSYFKRPCGDFAARLIDEAGLKGMRIGDACISEKHAGFIVNLGEATAEQVIALEEHVRNTVYAKFGIELEREVRFIK